MEKKSILIAALVASASCHAVQVAPVMVEGDIPGFGKIPAIFTIDNKSKLYAESYNFDSGSIDYRVLDGNLKDIKTFTSKPVKLSEEDGHFDLLHDGIQCSVTQSFFNNDANYEYVVAKYSSGSNRASGINVYNDKGETVLTIDFPNGYVMEYDLMAWADRIDGNNILIVELEAPDDEMDYVYAMYNISDSSAAMKPVIVRSNRVRPTMPGQGEPVFVDFEVPSEGCVVSIVGMDGTIAKSIPVAAGVTSAEISTSGLSSGHYIVTVNKETEKINATHIIIR